ncbi:sensor domain-containing diguanylate cyclase [Sulfurimonas sp.]
MKEIFKNADTIALSLEHKLYDSIKEVECLHLLALHVLRNKEHMQLEKVLRFKDTNNTHGYALDTNAEVNLIGFEKAHDLKKYLQEMESVLELAPFLELVYKQNKNFAWVYYFSKHHFTVLYPYISSKDFNFTLALEKEPFFQYATPKLNPKAKLFFTPLYMDSIGKGLMITIGKPVYLHHEFLGTIDIDITLNNIDNILVRLDTLNHQSALYNEKHQLIASHNIIKFFNRSKIYKIDTFIPSVILNIKDTQKNLKYINSQYIFKKTLANSKFKYIYMVNVYKVWLQSFIYILPIFILMLFSVYLVFLYQKSKNLNYKLKLQTVKDYMTGAYNRRYFFEVAETLYLRAKRKRSKLAVIMIDIDDFKIINDSYGHDNGDLAIIEVRKILEKNLRKYDLFARFGGEEFCILLDDISKEDVVNLFEKIRKDFEENEIMNAEVRIHYTVSFGIAYGMMGSLEKLIKIADEALYASKQNGKNQVTIYEV